MRGKLIVIDGSDGSGKSTQLSLLKKYLDTNNTPVESVDFPQYEKFSGKMVGRFLRGEFGPLEHISPYLISYVYAADRLSAKPLMEKALEEGKIVLANRYASSNYAHQSGRLPKAEREAFVAFDMQLEYGENGIPKEDIVIFLHVPYKKSIELMQNSDRAGRSYAGGKQKDMVEENEEYLRTSEEAYLDLVEKFDHWVKISCVDDTGAMKSREVIHEEIKKVLAERKILS